MSVANHALGQREILGNVLYQLSILEIFNLEQSATCMSGHFARGTPSLLPSLLVNKLWADETSRLIWSRWGTLPRLLALDKDRRQYYARNFSSLSIPSAQDQLNPEQLDDLRSLEWPRMDALRTTISSANATSDFVPLGPFQDGILRIKSVKVNGSLSANPKIDLDTDNGLDDNNDLENDIDSNIGLQRNLENVADSKGNASNHPPVTSLEVDHISSRPETVISFLQDHPRVTHISLHCSKLTSDKTLMEYISRKSNLTSLSIILDPCDTAPMEFAQGSFPSLLKLAFAGKPQSLTNLLPHLVKLQEARVTILGNLGTTVVQNNVDDLISGFRHARELRSLQLRARVWGMLSSTQLMAKGETLMQLAPCRQLSSLRVDLNTGPDASDLTDEELKTISLALPRLETLHLPMKSWLSKISWTGLRELARNCPKLESLHLGTSLNLQEIPPQNRDVFPNLKSLILGMPNRGLASYEDSRNQLSDLLNRCFPKLQSTILPMGIQVQVPDSLKIGIDGAFGLFSIEPSNQWNPRSVGKHGPGAHVLFARIANDQYMKLASET